MDGQCLWDENQIKDGIERVVNGLQDYVNSGLMLFFALFAALRETGLSSYGRNALSCKTSFLRNFFECHRSGEIPGSGMQIPGKSQAPIALTKPHGFYADRNYHCIGYHWHYSRSNHAEICQLIRDHQIP